MIKALWPTLRKTDKLPAARGDCPKGSSCLSTALKAKANYSLHPVPSPSKAGVLWSEVWESFKERRPDFKVQNTKGASSITTNASHKPYKRPLTTPLIYHLHILLTKFFIHTHRLFLYHFSSKSFTSQYEDFVVTWKDIPESVWAHR